MKNGERFLKGIGLNLARLGNRKDVSRNTLIALLNNMPIAGLISEDEKEKVVDHAMGTIGLKKTKK